MNWLLAQSGSSGINWPRLIISGIVLLSFVVPHISKSIKERQKKREQQAALARQRQEMLRTGRSEPIPASTMPAAAAPQSAPALSLPNTDDEAKRRLAEIAARRRAELERLARQAQGGQAPPAAPPTAPAPRPATPTRNTPVTVSGPAQRPHPSPQQPPRRSPTPQQLRDKAERERKEVTRRIEEQRKRDRQQLAAEYHSASQAAMEDPGTVHRLVKDVPPEPPKDRGAVLRSIGMSPNASGVPSAADMRRAFIAAQIFGRPLSEQPDQ